VSTEKEDSLLLERLSLSVTNLQGKRQRHESSLDLIAKICFMLCLLYLDIHSLLRSVTTHNAHVSRLKHDDSDVQVRVEGEIILMFR